MEASIQLLEATDGDCIVWHRQCAPEKGTWWETASGLAIPPGVRVHLSCPFLNYLFIY